MATEFHNKPKSNITYSHHISSLASLLLLTLMIGSVFFAITHPTSAKNALASGSFGFTYAGDYDQKAGTTTKNLQKISQLYNANQISFNLGLGDYSYASTVTPAVATAWSNYAKSKLPTNFPFEIVDGRHDSSQISTYEADLPDHIGNITGTYGQQYYFDYPPGGTPLARFIMLSPNQSIPPTTPPNDTYNYDVGGADYNWVSSTIDDARCVNNPSCSHPVIPWVIVGMHEYCFVIGTAACGDQQLLDLLLNKHVDLIMQAQKHNYQASKQLALNSTTCPTLNATAFNANCVVNSTNTMTQGAGTVIMVTGTGGASQLAINTSDPKYNYFRTSTPTNNVTWGISQFSISATQLTEQFVPTSGGNFTDSFTITNTSTPTATPSPSITPSPSVMPSLGADNFTRADQTYWGTASDTQKWGSNANSLKVFSIKSNTGQVVGTSSNNYYATLGPPAIDAQVQFSGSISSFTNANLGSVLRWTDSQNWYEALIDGTNLTIEKKVAGTITKLINVPFAATAGTSYTVLFSITGSTLSASAWPTGGTQPGTWMATATDTSLTATGSSGLHVVVQSGVTVSFAAFQANSLP